MDSGKSESTVKRALKALQDCGLLWWVPRLVRDGWRAVQTSNAYIITLGEPPKIPVHACGGQTERETKLVDKSTSFLSAAPSQTVDRVAGQAALGRVRAAMEERLLRKASDRGLFAV